MSLEKLLAARDLLVSTRRTLQLVDEEIDKVKEGRIAVQTAGDISSEHRVAWFGATDDNDHQNGILAQYSEVATGGSPVGFGNPYRGTIRVQEDAAFVCTNIMVATKVTSSLTGLDYPNGRFLEDNSGAFDGGGNAADSAFFNFALRLTDANTGRNLTPGITTGPDDKDRGAIPLSFLSSFRSGLGSNVKNTIFSEFTIPRAGAVRVEVYNLSFQMPQLFQIRSNTRLYVTLFGYKVYGA